MAFGGIDFEIAGGLFMLGMGIMLVAELAGHSLLDRIKKKTVFTNAQGVVEVYPDPTTPESYTIDGAMYALDHALILNRSEKDWSARLFLYSESGTPRTETINKGDLLPNVNDSIRHFGSPIKDFTIIKGGVQNAYRAENEMLNGEIERLHTWVSNLIEDLRQGTLSQQETEKRWAQERGTWRRSENRKGAYPELPPQPQAQQQTGQQQAPVGGGYGV